MIGEGRIRPMKKWGSTWDHDKISTVLAHFCNGWRLVNGMLG
jgi:hypothetical protein